MNYSQTDTSTMIGIGVLGQSLLITSQQTAVKEAGYGIINSFTHEMTIERTSPAEPYLTLGRIWQCHFLNLSNKDYLLSISNSRFWKTSLADLANPLLLNDEPKAVRNKISEIIEQGLPLPIKRASSEKELLIKYWLIEAGRCALLSNGNLDTTKKMIRPAFNAIAESFIHNQKDISELWRFVVGQVAMMQPSSLKPNDYTIEDILNPARNFSDKLHERLPLLANTCADINNAYFSGFEYSQIIAKIIEEAGFSYTPEQIVSNIVSQRILKELIICLANPDVYKYVFDNRIRLAIVHIDDILDSAKACCNKEIVMIGGFYKLHALISRRPEKELNPKMIAHDQINRGEAIHFLKEEGLLASVGACSILNIDLKELSLLGVEISPQLKKHFLSEGLSL
ncbi:hypothetical protein P5704_028320 (plasmid) [Pseudomonas sp. FeN3W]|nr:hypothetical protein P5704_028320 [Pseudomonas sp. FeN3W]